MITAKLEYLHERISLAPVALIQLRVVLSNCPVSCLTPPTSQVIAEKLQRFAVDSDPSSPTLSQCLALLANKHQETADEAAWLSKCSDCDALSVSYVAKGLLMRSHRRCETFIEAAIENITTKKHGPVSFGVIVKPEPKVFPRDGGCTVRLLHPQRFMTFSIPRLLAKFETASDSGKQQILDRKSLRNVVG